MSQTILDERPAPAFAFDNSYARLPPRFFEQTRPTPVPAPGLVALNRDLAVLLGLDPDRLAGADGVAMLAGARVPDGAEPIALAYAGHQFGQFVPSLGDGRAVLLGEIVGTDGVRRDIQLKGSGPTAFSRRGDGRAALGPVIREFIVSEAMAAFGVPTTRALAAVTTGERVLRDDVLPGAVLTRVAASHLRVGTFEYFAARGDLDALRILADYAIARHDPAAAGADVPARALLAGVAARSARLVALWMSLGFIHGVMNTDNTAISGETIDYGPCAFLDAYDPATVFSAIDVGGRYAFANQPRIMLWNLARLAEALLPLLAATTEEGVAVAEEVLGGFGAAFDAHRLALMRGKLGLLEASDGDAGLAADLHARMAANGVDFTLLFTALADAASGDDAMARALFADAAAWDGWVSSWRARLATEGGDPAARAAAMRRANPVYIPRNHLVEAAIEAAVRHRDDAPMHDLVAVLRRPFERQEGADSYALPPRPEQRVLQTFCGT